MLNLCVTVHLPRSAVADAGGAYWTLNLLLLAGFLYCAWQFFVHRRRRRAWERFGTSYAQLVHALCQPMVLTDNPAWAASVEAAAATSVDCWHVIHRLDPEAEPPEDWKRSRCARRS